MSGKLPDPAQLSAAWEPVLRPEGPADWFQGAAAMPAFDPATTHFHPAHAWWLSELCRIVYTPDQKESPRPWHRDKPSRQHHLATHTPFTEVRNLHKTGNHASLYLLPHRAAAILCFRGTSKLRQWLMNLTALPVSWPRLQDGRHACVHQGFQLLFDRIWPVIEPTLIDLDTPLILTGHSLGGAFATLAAAVSPIPVISVTTFGAPRVGNQAFIDHLRALPIHRVVHHHDLVPLLPQTDERLGRRDFRHPGPLHYLGKKAGEIHTHPAPPSPGHPPFEPPDPLELLRASLTGIDPPECLLDHAPVAYSEKLKAAANK